MANNDVTLDVGLDTSDANKSLKQFQTTTTKSLGNIESSFASLKTIAAAAVGVFAGRALIGGIKAVTDAASVQQDAINGLNTALKLSGEFTQSASQEIQDFATSIQQATKFGDEAILQQFALAKAFGASNEQAKLITTAATELAAATGKSLDEATRQVSKTLGGFAGELGEVNPAIKALTQAQLKNGEAAKILIDQYGGSAASQVNTFSGAAAQLQNTFGDLLEEIGFLVTNNPAVIDAFKNITKGIQQLITDVKEGSGEFAKLVGNIAEVGQGVIPLTISAFKGFVSALNGVKTFIDGFSIGVLSLFNNIRLGILQVVNSTFSAVSTLTNFIDSKLGTNISAKFDFSEAVAKNNASINTTSNILEALANQYAALRDPVEGVTKESDKLKDSSSKAFNVAKKAAKGLVEEVDKAEEAIKNGVIKQTQALIGENSKLRLSISKIGKTTKEQIALELKFQTQKIDNTIAALDLTKEENVALKAQLEIKKDLLSQEAVAKTGDSTGSGGSSSSSESKEGGEEAGVGFIDVVSGGLGVAADAFNNIVGGGFAKTASGFIEGLANIPNVFAEVFESFDKVALSLADSFASAIESILKRLPEFITKALESLKEIGSVLIAALPEFVSALAEGFVDLVDVLVNDLIPKLIKQLPAVIKGLIKAIPRLITTIAKSLGPIVRALAAALPEIVQVLADNLSPIVIALVEGIIEAVPDIIVALVDELIIKGGIFRIAFALVKAILIDLPVALAKGFVGGIFNTGAFEVLGKQFSKGITFPKIEFPGLDRLEALFDTPPFLEKLQAIFDSFNPSKAGGGGGPLGKVVGALEKIPVVGQVVGAVSNAVANAGKSLGFADGGTVPAGFPNDSLPARLTSGEEVISQDRAKRLDEFLDGGGSGQNVVIKLQVGEKDLADVIYNLNRRGFRTA